MNVLFFPYWPANPYQPNLAAALKEREVIVNGVRGTSFQDLADSVKDQDILHLHWTNPYILAPKISASVRMSLYFFKFLRNQKKRGRKLVWTIHNLGEHEPRHPVFELFCHRILAWLSDGIIVHNQYARDAIVKAYRLNQHTDKIRVIPHGNYINNYPNNISREKAREKLGIGLGKKVFLFFGAMREYKGLPELVAAFNEMASGIEVLLLAGNPLNGQIETRINKLTAGSENVIFYPHFIQDEDVQIYMNAADIVVFPFRDIFTSGSVLLAMSFAKPVLIPDIESLEDVIMAGGVITYDPKDSRGLKKAMTEALSADFQQLGIKNFQEAQRLSWESIAEETAALYTDVLN